jgi:hypothetical protein
VQYLPLKVGGDGHDASGFGASYSDSRHACVGVPTLRGELGPGTGSREQWRLNKAEQMLWLFEEKATSTTESQTRVGSSHMMLL